MPRARLPQTDEDEFYHEDLIGLDVVDRAGALRPGRWRWSITAPATSSRSPAEGGTDLLLPFTREAVPEIDLAARPAGDRPAGRACLGGRGRHDGSRPGMPPCSRCSPRCFPGRSACRWPARRCSAALWRLERGRHPRLHHRPAPDRRRYAVRRRGRHGDAAGHRGARPGRCSAPSGDARPRLFLSAARRPLTQDRGAALAAGPGRGAAVRPLRRCRPARHRGARARRGLARRLRALGRRDRGHGAARRLCAAAARRAWAQPDSLAEESFADGLLEYPHYTRPQLWEGRPVPEVLLSGHHARIRAGGARRRWR